MLEKIFGWKTYLYLLPLAIFIIAFLIYPLIFNTVDSFENLNLNNFVNGVSQFVGFNNYTNLFSKESFYTALYNTFVFTVISIFFQFTIGFLIALLFNRSFPLKNLFIGFIMLPWFTPSIVYGEFFRFLFGSEGILNNVLMSVGFIHNPVNWITNPVLTIFSLTMANIWLGIPFNFALLYTGLKGLPSEVLEAADIDGANRWQKVLYVIFPMLRPVVFVTLILGTIGTVKVFDLVWIVTQGGPANSSQLFSTLSYTFAFNTFNFGLAAATIVIMSIIVIAITSIFFIFQPKS
jgi:multiple sugar transport system permease protein|uniref:Sugar ABC transporter permease n=1 Tax=Thermodesulfobium narugense TaxID=184064 RepID=A0A7C5P925_9BACT